MIIKLLKGQFLQKQFRKELMFHRFVFSNIFYFGNINPNAFKRLVKVPLAEIFETVNWFILVHLYQPYAHRGVNIVSALATFKLKI